MKIRSRKFEGRCAKHKGYNPAVDGPAGINSACPRCLTLLEIFETSLKLNKLIRGFDPHHDDLRSPVKPKDKAPIHIVDPRQMSLI